MNQDHLKSFAEYTLSNETWVSLGYGDERVSLLDIFVEPWVKISDGLSAKPVELLAQPSRGLVTGPPGFGKTTLLRYLALRQAQAFIQGESMLCPLLLKARQLQAVPLSNHGFDANIFWSYLFGHFPALKVADFADLKGIENRITLYLDGLDEVSPSTLDSSLAYIKAVLQSFPAISVILSSRPADYLSSLSIREFQLLEFDEDQSHTLIRKLSAGNPTTEASLFQFSVEHPDLTSSPLLLTTAWHIIKRYGFPSRVSHASLYADFFDYKFSTWKTLQVPEGKNEGGAQIAHRLLEEIALHQLIKGNSTVRIDDVTHKFEEILNDQGIIGTNVTQLISSLVDADLFVHTYDSDFSFAHKSFLEYYVARAFVARPNVVIDILAGKENPMIMAFVSEITPDVNSLVELALSKGYLLIAIQLVSFGKASKEVTDTVLNVFEAKVGTNFISLLRDVSFHQDNPRSVNNTDHLIERQLDLKGMWNGLQETGLTPNQKGQRLEQFACRFFGDVFGIVKSNLRTEAGELDIVLETKVISPFWIGFGSDAFVECKNWISRRPLKEVGAFSQKLMQLNVKLGFIVSMSGFTEDATRAIRNQALANNMPLLVPLDGRDIEEAVEQAEPVESFLKKKIRAIKYLEKF